MDTQCRRLIDYWKTYKGGLTTLDSMRLLGITSFHRRMTDLKESGYVIDDVWEKNENTGSRYKRYFLKYDPKDPTWTSVDLESIPVDTKTTATDFFKGMFKGWKGNGNG